MQEGSSTEIEFSPYVAGDPCVPLLEQMGVEDHQHKATKSCRVMLQEAMKQIPGIAGCRDIRVLATEVQKGVVDIADVRFVVKRAGRRHLLPA